MRESATGLPATRTGPSAGIVVDTDGSCLGNPGPGGWAVVVAPGRAGATPTTAHGYGGATTTNGAMELQAVRRALEILIENGLKGPVTIRSDSRYVVEGLTQHLPKWRENGWRGANRRPVANVATWSAIDELMRGREVTTQWVKGHVGDRWNEMTDQLANAAARTPALGNHGRIRIGSGLAEQIEANARWAQERPPVADVGTYDRRRPAETEPRVATLAENGARTRAIRQEAEALMERCVKFAVKRALREGREVDPSEVRGLTVAMTSARALLSDGFSEESQTEAGGGIAPRARQAHLGAAHDACAAFDTFAEPRTVQAILDHEQALAALVALGGSSPAGDGRAVAVVRHDDLVQAVADGPKGPMAAFVAANIGAVRQDAYAPIDGRMVKTGTLAGTEGIAALVDGFGSATTRKLAFDAQALARIALEACPAEASKTAAISKAAAEASASIPQVGKTHDAAPVPARRENGRG